MVPQPQSEQRLRMRSPDVKCDAGASEGTKRNKGGNDPHSLRHLAWAQPQLREAGFAVCTAAGSGKKGAREAELSSEF